MLNTLVVALIVASSVWVYLDATKHQIGKIPGAGGMFNMSAGGWAVVVLMLWIIAFPAYLIKRKELIAKAKEQPVAVSGRNIKTGILASVGSLWLLMSFAGAALSELPGCDSSDTESIVSQIINEIDEVKASGIEFITLKEVTEKGFNEQSQLRFCEATLLTTAGEDPIQYVVKWGDKEAGEFYVEIQSL